MVRPLITLTTDFSWSVALGICKGVIKRICPEADMVDVTHSIPHFDVEAGAFMLRDALPYLPVAIHVAVVDPGVGSNRRAVAVQAARGDIFIAPDNGLISLALSAAGGATAAVTIENPAVILTPTSRTFHARDIFCPAAAHLAAGVALTGLGPAIEPASVVALDIPQARLEGKVVVGMLLRFDPFGSGRTNVTGAMLEPLGLQRWDRVRLRVGEQPLTLPFVHTFSDVPPGEPCCLVDSSGRFCIAVNQGSARDKLGLSPHSALRIAGRDAAP